MLTEVPIPLKGINLLIPEDKAQGQYSPYMNNVRPFDTLEKKIRLGKRPGLDKMYAQQVGGTSYPIVWIGTITVAS